MYLETWFDVPWNFVEAISETCIKVLWKSFESYESLLSLMKVFWTRGLRQNAYSVYVHPYESKKAPLRTFQIRFAVQKSFVRCYLTNGDWGVYFCTFCSVHKIPSPSSLQTFLLAKIQISWDLKQISFILMEQEFGMKLFYKEL